MSEHVEFGDPVLKAGFTQIPNVVLRNAGLSLGARVLFGVLGSYAWQAEGCFPGQKQLASDLGVSERSVRTFLDELVAARLVEVSKRGAGQTNVYILFPGGTDGVVVQSPVPDKPRVERKADPRVDEVFEYWKERLGMARSRLTPKRREKIRARIAEGTTVTEMSLAIHGCASSEFHREKGYTDLTLILRSRDKVEQFMGYVAAAERESDFFGGAA